MNEQSTKKDLYYLKDKKAVIYLKIDQGVNGSGFSEPMVLRPVNASGLWCYTAQLTQNQMFLNLAYSVDETRLFVFNYRTGVSVGDFIKYNGVWYEITRVDTKDDYKTELFIYVKVVQANLDGYIEA